VLIIVGGLAFGGYAMINASEVQSRLWQSRVQALPMAEREAVAQYLTIQDLALNWLDASDARRNHHLVRLSANAEACLRQKLPELDGARIDEFKRWVRVGSSAKDDQKAHLRWSVVMQQYQSDYQQHRTRCDASLNFNSVEKRYPDG
jgi:hypothetical protein